MRSERDGLVLLSVRVALKLNLPTNPDGHPVVSDVVLKLFVSGVNVTRELITGGSTALDSKAPISHVGVLLSSGSGLIKPLWSVMMSVPHPFVPFGMASIAGLVAVHPMGVPDAVHRAMV